MKKLFQALVTTYLLAPCSALAINPFRSVDEARTFFNKERTFGKPGPVELSPFFTPMPPYDYDSGPIVKQRPVLAFPSFDPKATEQLNLCIYKINHTAYDPDDRSMKGLDEIRKHVENGADFTNWLSPSPILDRYADQNQHHAPLLKALLDRGAVLYDYDFYLFDQQPHDIQQLLLANCKGITNSGGENFLHQCT
ncbi:MAG: hypothetical protein IT346_01900, partial [Epsilonproteobacteria bacterium]|nr:hypothetical protein [Campylobacterota bacterium]